MHTRAELSISRLQARSGPDQPVMARLVAETLATEMAGALPALPPQALLLLPALQLDLPSGALARLPDARLRARVAAASRSHLAQALASAARPALGAVPADAPAVLFGDIAELLACLARDALAGRLDAWWWRQWLGQAHPDWCRAWAAHAQAAPAALRLLAAAGLQRRVMDGLAQAGVLASLQVHGATGAGPGLEQAGPPSVAAGMATVAAAPLPGVDDSPPPGGGMGDGGPVTAALAKRPPRPRAGEASAAMVTGSRGHAGSGRPAADGTPALVAVRRAAEAPYGSGPALRSGQPPAETGALPLPGRDSGASVGGHGAALPAAAPPWPWPGASAQAGGDAPPSRTPWIGGADMTLPSTRAALAPGLQAPFAPVAPAPASGAPALRRQLARLLVWGRPVTTASPPSTRMRGLQEPGTRASLRRPAAPPSGLLPGVLPPLGAGPQRIVTRYGRLLFLVNLLLADGLYPDFTRPLDRPFPLPVWRLLALIGRALAGPALRADPLWPALEDLAAGLSWGPPEELAQFRPSPATGPTAPRPRRPARPIRRGRAGRGRGARAAAGGPPGRRPPRRRPAPSAGRLALWLARYLASLRERLAPALGVAPGRLGQALRGGEASLWLSEAEVVLVMPLDDHPVAWRLAGLDRDPGWLPGTGRRLRFVFE